MKKSNDEQAKLIQLYPQSKDPIIALNYLLQDLEMLDQQLQAFLIKREE